MIELRSKQDPRAQRGAPDAWLRLPFELRQKTRLRTRLTDGEEVALMLPRGEILRGGEHVLASDGRVVEIIAEIEPLLQLTCATPLALARVAYHLGNRHVAVQLGDGFARIAVDPVLGALAQRLGAVVEPIAAAFEPEAGAYGGGHQHGDERRPGARGAAKIHQYGAALDGARPAHEEAPSRGHAQAHDHSHGHAHDHDHDHDHDHGHDQHHRQGDEPSGAHEPTDAAEHRR